MKPGQKSAPGEPPINGPTPARQLALDVLRDLGRSTLADRLAQADVEGLSPRDRGFLHELVLGTLRQRGWLDHALSSCLDQPIAHLDAGVLDILRLGAHQVLSMRVPDRAAVSESVSLCGARWPRAKGLVNAVLRRLVRQGPPAEPDLARDPLAWLVTAGSLHEWLAERWLARFGPARAIARARACSQLPPVVFRLNPRVAEAWDAVAALEPRPLPLPGAWQVAVGSPLNEPARAGQLYIQALGSQLVAHLAAGPGRLLDACAAPGGKATLAGDLIGQRGMVVAAEAQRRRIAALAAHVRRWQASNVHVLAADALRPPFRQRFERILVDAPCSGLGTLGRNPDVRWRVLPEDLPRQAQRQVTLLRQQAQALSPGGTLVYAVCSLEPEENAQVVDAVSDLFGSLPLPEVAAGFADSGFAQTCPEQAGGDGFFAAVLCRR